MCGLLGCVYTFGAPRGGWRPWCVYFVIVSVFRSLRLPWLYSGRDPFLAGCELTSQPWVQTCECSPTSR